MTSYTDPPENILSYVPWHFQKRQGWSVAQVEATRRHRENFICTVAGVSDRNSAAALKGVLVGVDEGTLPPAQTGEYYWRDLIGLEVVTLAGAHLGRVERLIETGANDVLVIRDRERESLVPFIDQVIRSVDAESAEIVVDWDPEF